MKRYDDYESYINHQKEKTLDPVRREKWLGEEWDLKLNGFKKEFSKMSNFLNPDSRCLCLGARTGQEVVALREMGIKNVVGIDIVPHKPYVIEGDIHDLDFDDNSFDFVYTNIIDHSLNPQKMISEIERVLKVGGVFYLQIQLGVNQDEYTVFEINNPLFDIVSLFEQSYCLTIKRINSDGSINFAAMNVELVFRKDADLSNIFKNHGSLNDLKVPEKYEDIWNKTLLEDYNQRLSRANILDPFRRRDLISKSIKSSYYMTKIAENFNVKNILEVGTSKGHQFFSFGEYVKNLGGKVYSCDEKDVRNASLLKEYKDECFYTQGSPDQLDFEEEEGIELFYINGNTQKDSVLNNLSSLERFQNKNNTSIWIINNFDYNLGCYEDITSIISAGGPFRVWNTGISSNATPEYHVMIKTNFKFNRGV